ncbi:hypothetical protein QF001_000959 [Paraburkholderia youngii]|uniref:hypothetical protein n=1 Tax=Paraburkholderia youngii TaxID=2782701 RepID=UPI003D1A1D6B
MKALTLLAAGFVALVLSACNTAPTVNQTPAQLLATVHSQVSIACAAAGPSLTYIKALEPGLTSDQAAIVDKVYTDATAFCAVHETVSVASVSDFANTAIPATLKLVNASSLSQDDKTLVAIGVIALQAALNAAVAQYNAAQPAAVAVGASA